MLRKAVLVLTVLAVLLAVVAGTALAADPAKGKTLWEQKNCKSCHGVNGEGNFAGPRAGDTRTAADWVKQVRTPRANMPSYTAAQVSDVDLDDMLAYMKTLTAPASFTAKTYTPAAGDLPGKTLYNQKRCVACHGADPTNFIKTRFTDRSRVVTPADVIKQVRTPAQNMPSFSATQLTDAEATQIAEYYKSLQTAVTATALPKAGDQFPLAMLALAGVALVLSGVGALAFARRKTR
jgi:LPXTG-motif cell wall-anchored protein